MKANLLDVYHDAVVARDQATAQLAESEDRQMALDELVDAVRCWYAADNECNGDQSRLGRLMTAEKLLRAAWDSYSAVVLAAEMERGQ